MIAGYGYEDASGSYFISIDTEKCNGCGECIRACTHGTLDAKPRTALTADDLLPSSVLDMMVDDYGQSVATVNIAHRNRLRYSCQHCKASKGQRTLPCVGACEPKAIAHSW